MSDKIYEMVTGRMVAALEAGTVPWAKPWSAAAGRPVSMSSGKPYRGVNVLLLGLAAMEEGYPGPFWGTYRQIAGLGGQVRRGERSTVAVFWKRHELPAGSGTADAAGELPPDGGEPEARTVPVLRYFRVFNAAQADGLPDRFGELPGGPGVLAGPQEVLDAYLAGGGPELRHVPGDDSFYSPAADAITVPPRAQFTTAEGYYATCFHECGHSTGHRSRLARPEIESFDHFGSGRYAREELVAEMTAAFLLAETGICDEARLGNSAAYIAGWLGALRDDRRLVTVAAGGAQKAADLIMDPSRPGPPAESPGAAVARGVLAGTGHARVPGRDAEAPAPEAEPEPIGL